MRPTGRVLFHDLLKSKYKMNYLAHLFLSSGSPNEMIGNFIGDYVKGKMFYQKLPYQVSVGVFLHRAIDEYTDNHTLHKETRIALQPLYGKFAGVIADMLFDHYLAKNFENYTSESLARFEKECYRILFAHFDVLPARVQGFLPKMRKASRLQSYAHIEGLFESLDIMSNYSSLPHKTTELALYLPQVTFTLEQNFKSFFDDLLANMPLLREQSIARIPIED